MGNVRFVPDSAGIRDALSDYRVYEATYEKAQEIAERANAMQGIVETLELPAYVAHRGSGSNVGIANVSTASKIGRLDNSKNHTLIKAAGSVSGANV